MIILKNKPILSFLALLGGGIIFVVLLAGLVKLAARNNMADQNTPGQNIGEIEMRRDINGTFLYK